MASPVGAILFLLPFPRLLPDGAPLQCPGQQQLRHSATARRLVLDDAVARQGGRCWVANDAAGCPWHSSCKSPRTLQKCKLLITKQLTFGAVLGEHKLSSPSTRLKVNHLCIRYLYIKSVRGDLHEGHFSLPDATFTSSRAQKPRFCARKARKRGFGRPKKHKNHDFVLGRLSLCAECRATARR